MSADPMVALMRKILGHVRILVENKVPTEFWTERVRWLITHDLKEIGTLAEKEALIDNTFSEITELVVTSR